MSTHPSPNHVEILTPSFIDVWQHTDPIAVIASIPTWNRLKRIHVKIQQEIFPDLTWAGICYPVCRKFVRKWVEKTGISSSKKVLG